MKAKFTGIANLKNPADLFLKLRHDIIRMEANPQDSYAAFDFFVTAEHILDWLHPDHSGRNARDTMRDSEPLLKITSHIANGAKHFIASNPKHSSVADINHGLYVEPGYVEDGYIENPIVVKLMPDEVKLFGCSEINAVELGRKVLAYWEKNIPT